MDKLTEEKQERVEVLNMLGRAVRVLQEGRDKPIYSTESIRIMAEAMVKIEKVEKDT
jgi:hypothetical protein